MNRPGEAGFASAQFLLILLFAAALGAGSAMRLGAYMRLEERLQGEVQAAAAMRRILSLVMADLSGDPSPGVNDFRDPVWAWDGKTEAGYTVSIRALSDRLNANFVRKNLFEKTALDLLLRPGRTADELQQFREERGLSLKPGAYRDFFTEEALERYVSGWGWASISLTDEFALRKLAATLTGSEQTAESVRGIAQRLLISRRNAGPEDLPGLFGSGYDQLFPFINAEPLMNVNHLDPFILGELAAYPGYGVSMPEQRVQELLARRERGGLDRGELRRVLGIDAAHPLNQYLGCVTWFWEITIADQRRRSRTILCRLPPDPAALSILRDARFTIIEQRVEPCLP